MESTKTLASLVEEVQSNIDRLQKAIAAVGQIKTSLKSKAFNVKSQIRDSISRHLEAMRNRETWLLGQVEVVQHIKEDVLRQQQAELNKALGRLQSTCSLLEESGEALDSESLECRVRESLSAVSDLKLTPEETNAISFLARNFELQESILKFGVVASDNPLLSQQPVPSSKMHQLSFRKKVMFFSPSGPSADWLMKRPKCDNPVPDVPKTPFAKLNVQDWLQPKQGPATMETGGFVSVPEHSIEHWLAKCQLQDVAKEAVDQKEALDNKDADDACVKDAATVTKSKEAEMRGWLVQSRQQGVLASPSDVFEYYKVVRMSESSKWLKKSGTSTVGQPSSNPFGETCRKIAASSSDRWLLRKPASAPSSKFLRSVSKQSCSECSCGMSSVCSDSDAQEKSMECEDGWSEISDCPALQKEDVETSSEAKSSLKSASGGAPNNDLWLLKRSSSQSSVAKNDSTSVESYKENLVAQSNQHWLQHRGSTPLDNKEADEETGSSIRSYISSLPVDNNQWLLKPTRDGDICKWLARSSSEKCKNCPRMCSKGLFKVFDRVGNSKDGWLMSKELY